MEKIVIGIDPGSLGFLSCIMPNGNIEFKSINESSVDVLNKTLCGWVNQASAYEWGIIVVMEQVHAIFGSSAKATFSFGEIFGVLKGLIMANNIPYHLVQPKEWQSVIWVNSDIVATIKEVQTKKGVVKRKEINTKKTSMNAAKRLFPSIDFRRNVRCKNIDDNKVDSLLIAEYGRRKNL